jgi:hypothetical protein
MKDNTLTLRRMGTGHKVLKGLFVLAAMIGLLAFVCTPASAKKRNIPYNEHFMLHFSVGLKYSTSGENTSDLFKDNSTFTQNYSLGMDGYVLDPRLMAFSASTTFRHESISVPETKNVSTGGFNLNVSFINRLDRNKGLKLWKYMPAPISMNYSYYDYGSSTVTSFNLFTLYSMPGYVRMFGSGRFIFYDDGSRGKLDTNRYRVKYRKPSTTDNLDGNWNENEDWNGNWNGNGNGNGNWNGNGNGNWNGNWNRNGNGNWNGNWNRNGNGNWNGNWNRNGNGNWNGNWNRNGNGNWNGNQNINQNRNQNINQNINQNFYRDTERIFERRLSLFRFKFPNMNLRFNRSTSKSDIYTANSTFADFTASVRNQKGKIRRPAYYISEYDLHYTYTHKEYSWGRDFGPYHVLNITTSNQWNNLGVHNYVRHTNGSYRSNAISSSVSYRGTLRRRLNYNAGFTGTYKESDSVSDFLYSFYFGSSSAWDKRVDLSPKLFSITTADVHYSRSQSKDIGGTDSYGVGVDETLTSTHFKRAILTSGLGTGYSGPGGGVPISFRIHANSRGFRRVTLSAGYTFNINYLLHGNDRTKRHMAEASGRFVLRPHIFLTSRIRHAISETENKSMGDSRYDNTSVSSTLSWKISSFSLLTARATANFTDDISTYAASTQYSSSLYRGIISLGASLKWDDQSDFENASQRYTATYSWAYGKFSFSGDYMHSIAANGTTEHTVNLRASRAFGRMFNRLF